MFTFLFLSWVPVMINPNTSTKKAERANSQTSHTNEKVFALYRDAINQNNKMGRKEFYSWMSQIDL